MKTGGKLNNTKVIFLDFNGVLDTRLCMDDINEDNLKRLQHIVSETGAEVVISSSLKNKGLIVLTRSYIAGRCIGRIAGSYPEGAIIAVVGSTPTPATNSEINKNRR